MIYTVYILYSDKLKRYYVGVTSDIDSRLLRHNRGRNISTKLGLPWKLVYSEEYGIRLEAYRREKQIKSWHGGNAFKKLLCSIHTSGGGIA